MKENIERHNMHFNNLIGEGQPSLDLELENGSFKMQSKERAETNRQLRIMRGEDLHGLSIPELQDLEKTLQTGLNRVMKRKAEQIVEQINDLLKKGCELMEENTRLRYQVAEISKLEQQEDAERENAFHEDGQSSESTTTHSRNPLENDGSSDTSLKLGLSCSGWK